MSPNRRTLGGRLGSIGLVLGALVLASVLVVRAAGLIGPLIAEEANGNRREVQAAAEVNQPTISFIDSPSATCDQPVSGRNDCYVSWTYLYVTASTSQYIISMTVSIDNRLRAYHSGFFQTYMYIPNDMVGRGFKVACGSSGPDGLGKSYPYTLRARESGGLAAANYGSVQCPGVHLMYAPVIRH